MDKTTKHNLAADIEGTEDIHPFAVKLTAIIVTALIVGGSVIFG